MNKFYQNKKEDMVLLVGALVLAAIIFVATILTYQ